MDLFDPVKRSFVYVEMGIISLKKVLLWVVEKSEEYGVPGYST